MQTVNNESFKDFPIDFFHMREEYFNPPNAPEFNFTLEELPLEGGYITPNLIDYIDFNGAVETLVINCAVGQGKTSGMLDAIRKFNQEEDNNLYYIIAVPLVSLVSQYKNDLLELGIAEEQIFMYDTITDEIPEVGHSYRDHHCRFHIVTVNTLLGNPGEDAVLQSEKKYKYIRSFAEFLNAGNKPLCIIFDEIHEAISNFSEEGFLYLQHFNSNLQKSILLSATFNVQSIPVIKMLARVKPEKKIRILETPREVKKPQSNLFLHYDNSYDGNNYQVIINIIEKALRSQKTIDILSYSKKLSRKLLNVDHQPGMQLARLWTLQECTSENNSIQSTINEDTPSNRFDNSKCNIGTNFKSGVSITKDEHCFIIVLPSSNSRTPYKAFNGIFTEGVNAVIQAVARQRKVGDIHIVLPNPLSLDFNSLPSMTFEQKRDFKNFYRTVSYSDNAVRSNSEYISFNDQYLLIQKFYNTFLKRIEMPLHLAMTDLEVPTLDKFILNKGGKIISTNRFLGQDLASYVSYAAFTNQFYNARLKGYEVAPRELSDEELLSHIANIYTNLNPDQNINKKYYEVYSKIKSLYQGLYGMGKIIKMIYNYLIEHERNISNLENEDCSLHIRYLRSYFNNFSSTTPGDLETVLRKGIIEVKKNLFTHNGKEYFRNYEQSPIFEGKANLIISFIQSLKTIAPLNSKAVDFYRHKPNETPEETEKRFYKFLIQLIAKTKSTQVTVAGIKAYHMLILKKFD